MSWKIWIWSFKKHSLKKIIGSSLMIGYSTSEKSGEKIIRWDPMVSLCAHISADTKCANWFFFCLCVCVCVCCVNNVLSKPWSSPMTREWNSPPQHSWDSIPETNRFRCQKTFPGFRLKFPLLNFIPVLNYKASYPTFKVTWLPWCLHLSNSCEIP